MKIRMLISIGGSMAGREQTYWDVNRGDVLDVSDELGEQYVASQIATARLKGELPHPNTNTEEAEALREKVARRLWDAMPEEHKPVRGPINIKRGGQLV